MKTKKVARYGWRPDTPDIRDLYHVFGVSSQPRHVDLRSGLPVSYDQGQLGSCTANAIGAAYEFGLRKQGKSDFMPSRLFIYYNERLIEGSVRTDAGAEIRDGIKTLASQGVCTEASWPYVVSKFARKPPKRCYTQALKHQALVYKRVNQTVDDLRATLASGLPVVIGFSVYDSFESQEVADTGILNMPDKGESLLGGHAVLVVGYDDSSGRWIVRNSWGTSWGMNGHFTMPYAYLTDTDLSSDFWTVQIVEG